MDSIPNDVGLVSVVPLRLLCQTIVMFSRASIPLCSA